MLSVYCVSHKAVELDGSGIQLVGVAGANGECVQYCDSHGQSISYLNDRFSELTGHYYVWKNLVPGRADAQVGFCHYRRFLIPPILSEWADKNCTRPFDNRAKGGEGNYSSGYLIDQRKLSALFMSCNYCEDLGNAGKGVDIVLPKRNLLQPGGFRGQYQRCHPIQPFDIMMEVICHKQPRMAAAAHEFFEHFEYAYWNNLFIARFELFSRYCAFAFEVLLQVSNEIGSLGGVYQNRACAFLSERLFNFWIYYNNLSIREVDWCVTSEIQGPAESHQVAITI